MDFEQNSHYFYDEFYKQLSSRQAMPVDSPLAAKTTSKAEDTRIVVDSRFAIQNSRWDLDWFHGKGLVDNSGLL